MSTVLRSLFAFLTLSSISILAGCSTDSTTDPGTTSGSKPGVGSTFTFSRSSTDSMANKRGALVPETYTVTSTNATLYGMNNVYVLEGNINGTVADSILIAFNGSGDAMVSLGKGYWMMVMLGSKRDTMVVTNTGSGTKDSAVVFYKGEENIAVDTVSLKTGHYQFQQYEIITVNNNSTAVFRSRMDFWYARTFSTPVKIFAPTPYVNQGTLFELTAYTLK